jgi:hypothetical protein
MDLDKSIIQTRVLTPRAAAIAGILFSILLITSLVLIRRVRPMRLRFGMKA